MAKSKEVLINVTVKATDGINALNQVEKSLTNNANAAKEMSRAVKEATEPLEGSVSWLQKKVNALEADRNSMITNSAEYKKAGVEIDNYKNKISELSGAKGLGSVSSAAGIAGATLNEFGRLVSDAPFGIIAITNNLSQLGSLFAILVSQASQMNNELSTSKNVFNLLKAQFLGPGGVLFVFQIAISLLTLYAQRSAEAASATEKIAAAAGAAGSELKVALDALNNENVANEDKLALIERLNREYPKLNLVLGDNNKLTEDSTIALREQIVELERAAKARAILGLIEEEQANLAKAQSKIGKGLGSNIFELAFASFKGGAGGLGSALELFFEEVTDKSKVLSAEAAKEAVTSYKDLLTGEGLLDYLIKGAGSDTDAGRKAKMQISQILSVIDAEIRSLESIEGSVGDEENLEQKERKKLNKLKELRLERLAIEKQVAIEEAKLAGFKDDELALLRRDFQLQEMIIISDHNKAVIDVYKKFNKELNITAKAGTDTLLNGQILSFKEFRDRLTASESESRITAFKDLKKTNDAVLSGMAEYFKKRQETEENGVKASEDLDNRRIQRQIMAIATAQEVANGIFDIANAQFDKELTLEQNKTVEINNQLKERLRNEQLSADERKNIQNQIAQNDEALRRKQEAIEEKRFKLNKAASLANAVVNTYLAATGVLAETKGDVFARVAGMVAVIGAGLAQVAVIAKQRFVKSDAGGAPGISASSAPNQIQAPDFNVVGQSNVSQLADVVRGQLDRPVKTYVVTKDVTTAQELDRNRVSAASI